MTYVSDGKIALIRFERNGVRSDHYASLEDMLEQLLMNSGEEIPFLVRDKLLPPAIKTWEETLKREACADAGHHKNFRSGQVCKRCGWICDYER